MNTTNNEGPQPWIDPALEARVVAGVLGETSAFEAAELDRVLAENPELAIFKRRIEAVHALVGAAVRPEAPKIQLSPDRRQKLLEKLGARPAQPTKKVKAFPFRRWLSPHMLNRLVACVVIMAFVAVLFSLSIPAVTGGLHKASRRAILATSGVADPGSASSGSDFVVFRKAGDGFVSGDAVSSTSSTLERRVMAQNGQATVEGVLKRDAPTAGKPMDFAMNVTAEKERNLEENAPTTPSAPVSSTDNVGTPVPGKPGFVTSPYSPYAGYVDVRGFPPGTEVKDPYTGKSFQVNGDKTANGGTLALGTAAAASASSAPSGMIAAGSGIQTPTVLAAGGKPILAQQPQELAQLQKSKRGDLLQEQLSASGEKNLEKEQYAGTPPPEYSDVFNALHASIKEKKEAARRQLADLRSDGQASSELLAEAVQQNKPLPKDRLPAGTEEVRDSSGKFDGYVQYGAPISANTVVASVTGAASQPFFTGAPSILESSTESPAPQAAGDLSKAQVSAITRFSNAWGKGSGSGTGARADVGAEDRGAKLEANAPSAAPAPMEVAKAKSSDADKKASDNNAPAAPALGDVPLAGRLFWSEQAQDGPAAAEETKSANPQLAEAKTYLASGRYDLAAKRYNQVLSADPDNAAARRGLEQLESARAKYYETAYNEARSDILKQVDRAWSSPVRKFAPQPTRQLQSDTQGTESTNRKLDKIIIPKIDFRDVTVREALEFIKQRATSLDSVEQDTALKGVNVVLESVPDTATSEAKISLSLTNVPLRTAIDYVAQAANMKFKVEPNAVVVAPVVECTDALGAKVSPPSSKPPPTFQTEIAAAKQPFSTFSLHVSDVSFQLAKDALARGSMPDPDRIRAEEFYNAFDYGDPSPAPGEEVACRIEQCAHPFLQQRDLVRIALKVAAAGRAAGQPLRLTILLDTSGSMEREDRAASVRRALATLATLLGPNDRVTLIGFARTPRLLAEQVPGDQAKKLVEIAARTPSEGGTNLELALGLASELALKQKLPAAQNRIVLLTDGAANLGDANPARLARQIEKTRQQGISFDACGVGANGLNDEILEALTRKGDGRYYFLNKPEDADAGFARQLAGALRPAAENVKVQVVFNPGRVSQYRLIGFEKHLLKKEDFRNDKVQAAELSAEEAGVAVYQVQTLPEGDGELGEVFVRFRDPANGQMIEHSWTMPYDAKAPSFDKAAPSMQLAATAALLAEKLRGDSQVDLNALAPVITNLRGQYPHQAKVADLIRMFEQMRR